MILFYKVLDQILFAFKFKLAQRTKRYAKRRLSNNCCFSICCWYVYLPTKIL